MKLLQVESQKRPLQSVEGTENQPEGLSKRKLKKLERYPRKALSRPRESFKFCVKCPNPVGTRCESDLCRTCCHAKCFENNLDCVGHKILIATKRQKAAKIQSTVCDT